MSRMFREITTGKTLEAEQVADAICDNFWVNFRNHRGNEQLRLWKNNRQEYVKNYIGAFYLTNPAKRYMFEKVVHDIAMKVELWFVERGYAEQDVNGDWHVCEDVRED